MTYAARVVTALSLVLSSGVALLALLVPNMTEALQIATIAFGNSLIGLGAILILERNTTSVVAPVLPVGTVVRNDDPASATTTVVQP